MTEGKLLDQLDKDVRTYMTCLEGGKALATTEDRKLFVLGMIAGLIYVRQLIAIYLHYEKKEKSLDKMTK